MNRDAPSPERTLAFRDSPSGPLTFIMKPGETIEPGDLITLDRATGKMRKFVSGVDTGQAFTVPLGSRVTEDGYLEMPR